MTTPTGMKPNRPRLFAAAQAPLRIAVASLWSRALLGAGAAVAVGRLVDRLPAGEAYRAWLIWLGILLTGRALLGAIGPLTTAETATRVEQDLRTRVLRAVLALPPGVDRRTGSLVTRATEGISAVGALGGVFLPQLIAGMTVPLLIIAVVAWIDPLTALILLLAMPLVPLLLRILETRFASVSTRYRETADRLAARFLDGVQGLTTLKAVNRADDFGREIEAESESLRVETMRLLRVNQLALLAVDSLFTLGTVVAAAALAGLRLVEGAVTVGEAVTLVVLGMMLIEPLSAIGRFFYVGAIGRAAATQVGELLSLPAPAGWEPGEEPSQGTVILEEVGFAYPDGTVALESITLTVSPGETVALVGPSGAGKTTLAHLVLGLLHPGRGRVRVGGRATLVPQRPYLFAGTVADNLRLARSDATEVEMWSALEAAELADLLRNRPSGLDTHVGERGLRLSGGEVQRLAIARALLVDSPVVVLDEPTSNVDLDTEARIRSALDRLTRDRTVIVIAHRRSTIEGVDRVIRLEGGHLVDVAGEPR